MLTTTFALALSFGLIAEPPAAPAPTIPLDVHGTSRDFDKPPPGSAADQALWRSAHDLDVDVVVEQHAAAKVTQQAKTAVDRLRDPSGRGTLDAGRAEELAKRIEARWIANVELVRSNWPVSRVRVCRYELMNFDGVMTAGAAATTQQLAETRRDLGVCVEKATAVLKALRKANEDLAAASAEAERALGPPAKATAAAPSVAKP